MKDCPSPHISGFIQLLFCCAVILTCFSLPVGREWQSINSVERGYLNIQRFSACKIIQRLSVLFFARASETSQLEVFNENRVVHFTFLFLLLIEIRCAFFFSLLGKMWFADMNSDSDLYNRDSIVLTAESGYHQRCISQLICSPWWRRSSLVCTVISATSNTKDRPTSLFGIYKGNKVECPSLVTVRTMRPEMAFRRKPQKGWTLVLKINWSWSCLDRWKMNSCLSTLIKTTLSFFIKTKRLWHADAWIFFCGNGNTELWHSYVGARCWKNQLLWSESLIRHVKGIAD